jgi:Zn-dependent peptidase ImmA (M78 family)
MTPRQGKPDIEAERVLARARAEFGFLGEPWDAYQVDVDLVATLLFDMGVQRVPDLRVGDREYAGFLDAPARLIAIESGHHPHRQRFSVAHEIGHFVLHYLPHPKSSGLFTCTTRDMEASGAHNRGGTPAGHFRQEVQANLFAGSLLMPEAPIRAMHKVTGGKAGAMARHFKVSPKAMEIRLSRLHLPYG